MSRICKACIFTILISIIVQATTGIRVYAAYTDLPQLPPTQLRVEASEEGEPPIGYNEFDKYYVDLKWNVEFNDVNILGRYVNLYVQEVPKAYKPSTTRMLKARDISGTLNSYRIRNLSPGTIYYFDMTAYHTHADDKTVYSSPESVPSNKVKVLTDINIYAYSHGTNKIKIEWDDVWDTNGRIDYKLYVSENESFTNTRPIYIGRQQIGEGKSVTVNETSGKLEYIHTVRDAGRVYYIRIEPDLGDSEIKRTDYTKTVAAASYILVKTSKVSTSNSGIIWKLEWSPVVTGLGDTSVKTSYHIYRGSTETNDLAQYMAAVDGTNFFVTLPPGDSQYYFIIRAIVTKDGDDLYRGIRIESDRIIVGEQEVASRPVAPELVEKFDRVEGDTIISYKGELTPHSATILWRLPYKGTGEVDTDVAYDIWLVSDPDMLDNPPEGEKIESDFRVSNENYVLNGNKLVGYKYVIDNLTQNSTYYFKIVAKKVFIEYMNDVLTTVTYNSDPALKVITTPADGPIDQPVVPARPPLKIKETADNGVFVTSDSVTIQLKNLWYEKFNFETETWEYIRSEKLSESDIPPYNPNVTVADDVYYRKVSYDSGVTLDVGCIKYVEGMSYEQLKTIQANQIVNYPVTANDPLENPRLNPDGLKHNIDIKLTGLEDNTIYVIWVRAVRRSLNLTSEPSDPIIVTTIPVIVVPVEKPIVPAFNYGLASDNYIDVGWNLSPGYNYYLRYGLEDNPNSYLQQVKVTAQELKESIYYRIKDLKPDTLYYIWVQAEAVNESGIISTSEWSDSYSIRTSPYIPPETPKGFGIKNAEDAITKNSITFEWMSSGDFKYILEIADNIDYSKSTTYEVVGTEFKVEGLLSNHRYYARLYAYDATKDLKSAATQSITVRTKRSSDDYDADQNIEDVISGEFVEKDSEIINDTWNIKITGINADRFAQHVMTDKKLDYRIDISTPPAVCSKVKILISDKVFKALTSLGENLIIENGQVSLILRPGALTTNLSNPLVNKASGVDYEIEVSLKANKDKIRNIIVKEYTGRYSISAKEGANSIPFDEVLKPLMYVLSYYEESWYREGKTSGYVYDDRKSQWNAVTTSASFNRDTGKGKLIFETLKTGDTIVGESGKDYYDDIYYHKYEKAINNVASVYDIKSVGGRLFEPDLNAKLGDTVKLMFDVLDYQYGSDFMNQAARAGLISNGEIYSAGINCTVEKAYSMVVRLLELKSGVDLTKEQESKFISENGFTIIRDGISLSGDTPVRRGEVMYLLEKLMVYLGEIE